MLAKVASAQETHGAPPGYYLLLFWLTFWPGAVLAGLAAPAVWKARREPGAQFLLAWLVPSWIVFEAVVTKLPHYVLPLYPAIAILIAGILDQGRLSNARWLVRGTRRLVPVSQRWSAIAGGGRASSSIGAISASSPGRSPRRAMMFGLFAWRLYEADGPERALLRGMVASVFVAITVYAVSFPSLPPCSRAR